jgi:hypothetical protein
LAGATRQIFQEEIAAFAGNDARFAWQEETYFGVLFQ